MTPRPATIATRLLAASAAIILAAVPYATAPRGFVAGPAMLGLLFAAFSVITLRRGPGTAAACIFVADYALALWVAGPRVAIVGALGFGLSLLLLLHALELARVTRHGVVDSGVVRSQLAGWVMVGTATFGAAGVVMALARVLAGAVPFTMAPLVAALGALGVVLALAATLTGASRVRD